MLSNENREREKEILEEEKLEEEKSSEEQNEEEKGDEKEKKIEELEAKIKELEDKILRNEAEYQNIKKRMEREKKLAVEYASERFALDLLSVIDALESGAKSFEESGAENNELFKKVKEGFDLTLEQFKKVFEKHGINPIEEEMFNPNVHNAIMQVESEEHESGKIVQTIQKGYTINERVLRPAMVSIAK